MLTNEQLANKAISSDVVDFALEQVNTRLDYAERTQAALEQRATNFLKFFLSLAVAGISAIFGLANADVIEGNPLILAGGFLPLAASCVFLVAALWDKTRGAPGSDASWWLREDTVGTDREGLAFMKACLIGDFQRGIDSAFKSNQETVLLIRWALALAAITPIAIVLAVRVA